MTNYESLQLNFKKALCTLIITLLTISSAMGMAGKHDKAAESKNKPLEKISVRQLAGQMIMAGFRGYTVSDESPIVRDITKYNLGGVILFDYDVVKKKAERNIQDAAQVQKLVSDLQSYSKTPLLIAIDQEGGRVARLKPAYGFPAFPSAQTLGEGSIEETYKTGYEIGKLLNSLGINTNFAPLLDVNVNPQSPAIGAIGRSFSSDPQVVASHAQAFTQGLNDNNTIACFKHFPGHGSASADSHKGVTDVSSTWTEKELIPYKELLGKPLDRAVMTAHIFNSNLDEKYPATLSQKTITGILRKNLAYDGVVITDDMQMGAIVKEYGLHEAVVLAINAGADILLFGNNLEYSPDIVPEVVDLIEKQVLAGKLKRSRLEESYLRIQKLKEKILTN